MFGCGFGLSRIDGHPTDRICSETGLCGHQVKKLLTAEIAKERNRVR
jgi:hypothetical protein